jgi:hypothetical protein
MKSTFSQIEIDEKGVAWVGGGEHKGDRCCLWKRIAKKAAGPFKCVSVFRMQDANRIEVPPLLPGSLTILPTIRSTLIDEILESRRQLRHNGPIQMVVFLFLLGPRECVERRKERRGRSRIAVPISEPRCDCSVTDLQILANGVNR